jgi:threonine/homoserine/homoserine lactone efflux protein
MTDALLKGAYLGLLLAISVGPIVFTVIKQSISNGVRGGLAFIAGISLSDILLVIAANLFTNLFSLLKAHEKMLAVIASIFLIIVGAYYLFFKKMGAAPEGKQIAIKGAHHYLKLFGTGFIMNIFNPGIIVFWLATSTAFLDHTLNQRIIIFGVALLIALLADVLKVTLAGKIRERMTPKNILLINRINGLILIGFGVVIIILQR